MASYDALELSLIGSQRPEFVRVREGSSVEVELDRFLSKTHGYEKGWVKVEPGPDGDRYVRYDQIASVEIRREFEDQDNPLVQIGS
jgi:hypothetical protein